MGVGTPENILRCIALGVDMFDCVMPTRNARNGTVFTTEGIMNMRNAKWKNDFSPLDSGLSGYVSGHYSKAYLRHLVHSDEMLGAQIASVQNLSFYLWLVETAREKILNDEFTAWSEAILPVISRRL
jgi:queuine tRNA-ribosyltransferase